MDSEREIVSIPIDKETGLPYHDFNFWTYSGNPAIMFAVASELERARKGDGYFVYTSEDDRLHVYFENGAFVVKPPTHITKYGLYAAARMVGGIAQVISDGTFSFIHAERLKQKFAKQPKIMVPKVGGIQ